MTKIVTLFTITFQLFGCTTSQKNDDEIFYVVKHPKTILNNINGFETPLLPRVYYGNFNFILLENSTFYYHQHYIYSSCGIEFDHSKPPRIFLVPDSLIKLEISDLPRFLETSMNNFSPEDSDFFTSISSPKDTIRSLAFKIITDFLKSKKLKRYTIRNWTEEEQFVTAAIINNSKKYDPLNQFWKIGFDTTYTFPPPW